MNSDKNVQATGIVLDSESQATGIVLDSESQATGIALDSESQATLPMLCCVQERVAIVAFSFRVRRSSFQT